MRDETKAIHIGYNKDSEGTMAVPIYQTTAYQFSSTESAADRFALKESGNIYTRIGNPTTDIFEKRFTALENGLSAVSTASGMSAIFYSIVNLAESGDNIIYSSKLYGGTITLFTHTLKRFGIEARAYNNDNPESIEKLIDDKTKAIFFESITNPTVDVADIDLIVKIADKYNIITIIDNTVATPILCKPLDYGVDVVIHSASKYTTGQGLAIGGIIIESKNCGQKIKNSERYYHFNEPDLSYHGLIYSNIEDGSFFTSRVRLALLRDIGAVSSPFNSWLFIQGLETLSLRMKQHSINGLKIAEFLDNHPKVKKVNYPALKSHKDFNLTKKYLKNGSSGLLSFIMDSFEDAKKVANTVKIFSLVTNIGDSKSIITHPASTTHQQLSQDELMACGVPSGLIRISCGLESIKDLIADIKQALEA